MSLKLIGAGFPRTGTMTLKSALETLGYQKTYHYKDLLADPNRLQYWKELDATGDTDFRTLFDGCQATVDFPAYPHYQTLKKVYPTAKVILTTRPFDDWYDSTLQTIWKRKVMAESASTKPNGTIRSINESYGKEDCVQYVRQSYLHDQFYGRFFVKAMAEKVFYRHHQEVKESIPAEDLLIYNVAEGWEPLCKFLGLSIPQFTFPHLNKKEDFHAMVDKMVKEKSTQPIKPFQAQIGKVAV